jgi:hypothetical protein
VDKNTKYHGDSTIEKRIWRQTCIEAVREKFPKGVPASQHIVILGERFCDKRGNVKPGSEVDAWLRSGLVKASQIVSVDCSASVVKATELNKAGVSVVHGNLDSVVSDMLKAKHKIAVVNADLMGTHMEIAKPIGNIMFALGKQTAKTMLIVNGNALTRMAVNPDWRGKRTTIDGLMLHPEFRQQFWPSKFNRSKWSMMDLTINGQRRVDFEYVSNRAPMSTIFLTRIPNAEFTMDRTAPVKATGKRQGNYSEGARKAWETRRRMALAA